MRSRVIGSPLTTKVVTQGQVLDDTVDVWIVKTGSGIAFGLPANPNDGDSFAVVDGTGTAGTNNILIQTGGPPNPPILGASPVTQVTINQNLGGYLFTYSYPLGMWLAEAFIMSSIPASQAQIAALQAQITAIHTAENNSAYFNGGVNNVTHVGGTIIELLAVLQVKGSGIFDASAFIFLNGGTSGDLCTVNAVVESGNGAVALSNAAASGTNCFQQTNGATGIGITSGSSGIASVPSTANVQIPSSGSAPWSWSGRFDSSATGTGPGFPLGTNVFFYIALGGGHTFSGMNATIALAERF